MTQDSDPDMTNIFERAFELGQEAFFDGKSLDQNPFLPYSEAWGDWRDGYLDVQSESPDHRDS